MLLEPFQCYPHPKKGEDGKDDKEEIDSTDSERLYSMVNYPDVLCYKSPEHFGLIAISIVSMLVFVLSFLVYFAYSIYIIPTSRKGL